MIVIEGYIRDSKDNPLSGIPVEIFQRLPGEDLVLTPPPPDVTDNKGYFNIILSQNIHIKNSQVYLAITDPQVDLHQSEIIKVDTKKKNSLITKAIRA
jgi:hypothetical protein